VLSLAGECRLVANFIVLYSFSRLFSLFHVQMSCVRHTDYHRQSDEGQAFTSLIDKRIALHVTDTRHVFHNQLIGHQAVVDDDQQVIRVAKLTDDQVLDT
jgi:hypothetical protein